MASVWRGGRAMTIRMSLLLQAASKSRGLCISSELANISFTSFDTKLITSPSLRPVNSVVMMPFSRGFASEGVASGPPNGEYITLNNIRDNPGARKRGRRVGRGIGSSKGKTAGRGHKGQKARSGGGPKLGFEGGQTPLRLRVPKRGFFNPFSITYHPLNLGVLEEFIQSGRLDPSKLITMKDLRDSGAVRRKILNGVKVLARGSETFASKIDLEVSAVSKTAREAIEKAGGRVTTVYYNKLGMRALLRPEWFEKKGRLLPRPARPPPKLVGRHQKQGQLPPRVSENSASM